MGKGKKNKRERALKAGLLSSPDIPAFIYRMPLDRTKPTRKPKLIPTEVFHAISDIMLQTAAPHRNVFLSMGEYRIQDINPSHKETSESPTHMIIFCLRLLVTDQFHPIGVVQIDKRIDQTDKLVHVWKTFIQDLSIIRLIVIGTISPPSMTFHKVLCKLTKIPNMKYYSGPITYSVWPYTDIVHLYDYYYLLHETQETLFERNEIYFMSCPPSEKSSPALQLLTASWTDILLVLTSQGINCYYTSEDPKACPLSIFFADFWKTYKEAGNNGFMDTESKESTDRLMELFCPFAKRLRAFKPFMCPCDLQTFYEDNEQLRVLLATAHFKKLYTPYSNRSSPEIFVSPQDHNEDMSNASCTSKSLNKKLGGICNTKTGSSIEISGNQMDTIFKIIDGSINDSEKSFDHNPPSSFDAFLQKVTLDGYDLFLKTSSKQSCTVCPLKKPETPKEVNSISHDHDYLKTETPKKAPSNVTKISSIYQIVNNYFGDAIEQHKISLRETESIHITSSDKESSPCYASTEIIQVEREENATIDHGSTATEAGVDAISSKNVAGDQKNRDNVLESPLDGQSNVTITNTQNMDTSDGYQPVIEINTVTSIDELTVQEKAAGTKNDKTSKIKESKIGNLLHSTRSGKKAKAKRLKNRGSVQKLVINLPFIFVGNLPEGFDPDIEEKSEFKKISKRTNLSSWQQNMANVNEITTPQKGVCCTINSFPSSSNIPKYKKTDNSIHTDVPAHNTKEVNLRIKVKNNSESRKTDARSIDNAFVYDKKKSETIPNSKEDILLDNSPKSILNSAIHDFSNILVSYNEALDVSNNNNGGSSGDSKQSVHLKNQSQCENKCAKSPTLNTISKNLAEKHDDLDLQASDSDSIDSLTELLTSIETNPIPTKIPCKYTLPKTPRCVKKSSPTSFNPISSFNVSESDMICSNSSALHLLKDQLSQPLEEPHDLVTDTKKESVLEALQNKVLDDSMEHQIFLTHTNASPSFSNPDSLEPNTNFVTNSAVHKNIGTSTTTPLKDLDVNHKQIDLNGPEIVVSPIHSEDSIPELEDCSLAEEKPSGCLDSRVNTKSTGNPECQNNSKFQHVMQCCSIASTSGHCHAPSCDVDNKAFLPHYTRFRKPFSASTSSSASCKSPVCPKDSSLQDEIHRNVTITENCDVGKSTAPDLTLNKSESIDDSVAKKNGYKSLKDVISDEKLVDVSNEVKDKPEKSKKYVADKKNKISLETYENTGPNEVRNQDKLEKPKDCVDDQENKRSPETCNKQDVFIQELSDVNNEDGLEEPKDYVEYKEYKRSLETCDNEESKCDIIYKDRKGYEGLYSQIPDDFETLRLTSDWLCTFKGYLKLKEILLARKVRQFQASALSLEHIDFYVHLIKHSRNKTSSAYDGQSYRLLDFRLAFDLLTLGKGVYIIKNDEHVVNNLSL